MIVVYVERACFGVVIAHVCNCMRKMAWIKLYDGTYGNVLNIFSASWPK